MTKEFEDACEALVDARMNERCQHHIARVQDIQEGRWHPDWRTAEVAVKIANESMHQVAPDIAADFYFYIHFTDDNYFVDATPPVEDEP
jgi:hypothetical protein